MSKMFNPRSSLRGEGRKIWWHDIIRKVSSFTQFFTSGEDDGVNAVLYILSVTWFLQLATSVEDCTEVAMLESILVQADEVLVAIKFGQWRSTVNFSFQLEVEE